MLNDPPPPYTPTDPASLILPSTSNFNDTQNTTSLLSDLITTTTQTVPVVTSLPGAPLPQPMTTLSFVPGPPLPGQGIFFKYLNLKNLFY